MQQSSMNAAVLFLKRSLLYILGENGWRRVKEIRDRVWRLVVIDLDHVKVDAVKVEVVRVSDSDRVIIPEIRIY